MYETDMIFRLSMIVGFLSATILAMLVVGAVLALRHCCKSAKRELDRMIDDMEKLEEGSRDERHT